MALDLKGDFPMPGDRSLPAQINGTAPLWFVFWVVFGLGTALLNVMAVVLVLALAEAPSIFGVPTTAIAIVPMGCYGSMALWLVWKCRHNSSNPIMLWLGEFFPKYGFVGGALGLTAFALTAVVIKFFE